MLYKYKVSIPLTYNCQALFVNDHNSSYFFYLENPIEFIYKPQFVSYKISDREEREPFEGSISILLENKTEFNEKNYDRFISEYICTIDGILGDDEDFVKNYTVNLIEKICKGLSLAISCHNAIKKIYQPRVEAKWSEANINAEEYNPYKGTIVSNSLDRTIIKSENNIQMTGRITFRTFHKTSVSDRDIQFCLNNKSEAFDFLMNEYYSALGTELVKSKFFHLFTMIEYCEHEYSDYNGATVLYSEEKVETIMGQIESIKEIGFINNSLESNKEKAKLSDIVSKLKKCLLDVTDIGRSKKLLNILHWMGIYEYYLEGYQKDLDEGTIKNLIGLRNKSFHGSVECTEAADDRYRKAVEILLCINAKILEFIGK